MNIVGLEHLHRHTIFSTLDGYAEPEEYGNYSSEVNQKFLCISDHGAMGAVPRQIRTCDENNLEPIFAVELYVNPHQPKLGAGEKTGDYIKDADDAFKKAVRKGYHLLAIAYNEVGYANLVRLSSWAWLHGYYYNPRVNHEILMEHKEGIIFTSCCYNSEIGQAFDRGGEEAGFEMVEKYMKMFPENFYLEIMLLDFTKQKPYDIFILKASEKYGLPIFVSQDCHYCKKDDSEMQRYMLMVQRGRTLKELEQLKKEDGADLFELQDTNLWMKSEEELNEKWLSDYSDAIPLEVFEEAKKNTVEICNKAKGVTLDRSMKLPQIPDANEKLKEEMINGFMKKHLPKNRRYLERLEEEYNLICKKDFASYFLIQKQMIDEAKRIAPVIMGYDSSANVVGPGRGSAAGSLLCFCLGITSVDPIKEDLLFSRFLSPARGGKQMKLKFKNIDPISPEQIEEDSDFKNIVKDDLKPVSAAFPNNPL